MLRRLLHDPITRDTAREEAERELRKGDYRRTADSPLDRLFDWLDDRLGDLFENAVRITPGGLPSLLLILLVVLALVVALRLGLGPTGLVDALTDRRRGARATTPDEYRDEAERLAADGAYKEAVRARFRAIIRELELRAVLDERAGRTAGEIAREGGAAVPAIAGDLRAVAATFDQLWYGDRAAVAADYALVREADDRIRTARLAVAVT